jgi:3-dehydroquinate synthase
MKVSPLTVTTPNATYPVVIDSDVLASLPSRLAELGLQGKVWLVSDANAYPHYGANIEQILRDAGYTVNSYQVASGEGSKDLATLSELFTWMIGGGVERRDVLLALGGGVVGDLAGFAAAAVLRGIAVVQIPSTLLAMVDSAIGGKTGINHPLGKNLIGAFHQPRLVLADTNTLATLPPREVAAGMAEVIKSGVIRDQELFDTLEAHVAHYPAPVNLNIEHLTWAIWRAAKVKVDVVNVDEKETGERMLLNYGHTLGHAIEALAGYGNLLHGEAVAIGMTLAIRIAHKLGMVDDAAVARQDAVITAYGLPTRIPEGMTTEQLLQLTLRDKKVRAGKVRWVLPTALGSSIVRDDVPEEVVRAVVDAAVAGNY